MVMEVIASRSRVLSSTLNPNAPPFVPLEFRAVEDFSDRWWELVAANPGFRDYWLRECFQPPEEEEEEADLFDDDDDAIFSDSVADLVSSPTAQQVEKREAVVVEDGGRSAVGKELVRWGSEKWHARKANVAVPKFADKAPKIVSVKLAPRNIQQPR